MQPTLRRTMLVRYILVTYQMLVKLPLLRENIATRLSAFYVMYTITMPNALFQSTAVWKVKLEPGRTTIENVSCQSFSSCHPAVYRFYSSKSCCSTWVRSSQRQTIKCNIARRIGLEFCLVTINEISYILIINSTTISYFFILSLHYSPTAKYAIKTLSE